jgi:hypothetical protein
MVIDQKMLLANRDHTYLVLPAYASSYCKAVDAANLRLGSPVRFWPGYAGGGIVSHLSELSHEQRIRVTETFIHGMATLLPYGTALGNPSALALRMSVQIVQVYRTPDFAVRLGLGKKLPEPSVKMTIEHVDSLGDGRLLLVVPKKRRKNIPMMHELPSWFLHFGISVAGPCELSPGIRLEMCDWFEDANRPMYAFEVSGGMDQAAWQFAVLTYIAEYWDVNAKGLDSLHMLANIESKPNFRRHWTSNK